MLVCELSRNTPDAFRVDVDIPKCACLILTHIYTHAYSLRTGNMRIDRQVVLFTSIIHVLRTSFRFGTSLSLFAIGVSITRS